MWNLVQTGSFIINPLGGAGGLASLFRTHPATEVRIQRLQALTAQIESRAAEIGVMGPEGHPI